MSDKDMPEEGLPQEEQMDVEAPEGEAEILSNEALLQAEIERLNGEVEGLKDQLLRAMAEAENVRARARREKEESLKHAAGPLAKDLLSVADNLRRAIESAGEEVQGGLIDGVRMTEKSLLDAFAKHSIQPINPIGEKLDPHRHEAMFEIPDPSQPQGTVMQVIEPGYMLHDRLLRPARVGVSKGGPKAGEDKAAAPPPGSQFDTKA